MLNWFKHASNQIKFLQLYCVIAALSFFTTLFVPIVGEEGDYALGTLEMLYNKEYIVRTLLNMPYGRPPLQNYFIAFFTQILGWQQVMIASRLLTALATILTGLSIYWFCQRYFKNKTLALLTTAIYFSGDLLFVRGWLAYSDPLFSLFIFLGIACMWLAVNKQRYALLCYAIMALTAAFLTKALTCYVFYGVAALMILWRHPQGKFLLSRFSIVVHLIGLALPLLWLYHISPSDQGMLRDIIGTAGTPATMWEHISHLIFQPLHLLILFSPASLIVIYLIVRKKIDYHQVPKQFLILLLLIIVINYLPYWISIKGEDPRYIEPLYPFFALLLSWLIYASKSIGIKLTCHWLLITIVLKLIAGLWGFYYYEQHYRSDYNVVAHDIIQITNGYPLYSRDVQFSGLSTAATIDILRGPQQMPISQPPENLNNGFILAAEANPGEVVFKYYPLKRTPLYLLCTGNACQHSRK